MAMRLIRSGALSPELNLALDEALLRSGTETLRLYAWDPPGFSLGFFQRAADLAPACPEGFRLVRRPTGGGAIAHTGELTISWIGRRQRVDQVYETANALVAAAVAALGVGVSAGRDEPEAAPAGLCFDKHTRYDLLANRKKLFGSAQRRAGEGFLLHGTLVLDKNPSARGAISLSELTGRLVARGEIEQAVIAAASEIWELNAGPPTAEEWAHAHRLVSERYGKKSWTARR